MPPGIRSIRIRCGIAGHIPDQLVECPQILGWQVMATIPCQRSPAFIRLPCVSGCVVNNCRFSDGAWNTEVSSPRRQPAGRASSADEAAILQVCCCAPVDGGFPSHFMNIHQANQQTIRIMCQGPAPACPERRRRRILSAECPAPWILRKSGWRSVFSEFPDTGLVVLLRSVRSAVLQSSRRSASSVPGQPGGERGDFFIQNVLKQDPCVRWIFAGVRAWLRFHPFHAPDRVRKQN